MMKEYIDGYIADYEYKYKNTIIPIGQDYEIQHPRNQGETTVIK